MRLIRYMLAAAAVIAASCNKDINERTIHEGSGLGFPEKVVDLEEGAGTVQVAVISTRNYDIISEASWLSVPAAGTAGRDGFAVKYNANNGLPRAARIIVSIEATNHKDTLTLRQTGAIAPVFDTESPVLSLKGSVGGQAIVALDTNIPDGDFKISHYCSGGDDWISSASIKDGSLVFDYKANPEQLSRGASITVTYTDAFDKVYKIVFQVGQMSSEDSFGRDLTLPELFALATETGYYVDEDLVIEGIVVSDKENGNCGDNTQLSATTIDYSVCRRTIYFESLDASFGIMLQTLTDDDNVFLQGDHVKFALNGVTVWKPVSIDGSPVYCYVTGVKGSMAVSCEHLGREGIPVKEKYIGSLTDEDIFTYVTLKDCELPVRKGSLTPVSEKFTSVGGADKVSKFAVLLHDICGKSMYMYTNTTCPYRRDGKALPEGSGNMSGVVVNELFTRFSYMDNSSSDQETWGNIGRYQLRHTCREDFGMAETMEEESFSAILCEWKYILAQNLELYYATGGDKSAYFTYSFVYPNSYTDGRAGKLPIIKYQDFSSLGPVSPDDLGVTPAENGAAWATNLTARNGLPQYTTLVFSTAGLQASRMSVQISSMNFFYYTTQKINGVPMYLEGPRFWYVEYSLDGQSWTKAGAYSLPEFCQITPMTQLWQTPGFKPVNIELPAKTLMGQDKVYVRIIPENQLRTGSQSLYLDSSIIYPASGSFPTAWNYIGVRYNTKDAPATDFGGNDDIDPMNPIDYIW
ncbi:MAG: BACON domain-containing protein [Bacteroidales bacterium]|nr:BACON domain-containing protein [Bacteroidales bacterium]